MIGPLDVGAVAHGGHCVARHDGRVVFLRHSLPGEVVRARVTAVNARFARADAIEVLQASPHRRTPPCPIAERCGGCDFQHVDPAFQRELKRRVVAELLDHLGGVAFTGQVEAVDPDDLGWRTRMRYRVAGDGRLGLLAHRSNEVVPLPTQGCRIAHPAINGAVAEVPEGSGSPHGVLRAAVSSTGEVVVADGANRLLTETVAGRTYRVGVEGFWQSHVRAPTVLLDAVLAGLQPRPGEVAFDLFCGVGLFSGGLAEASCRVWGIEGDARAASLARRNVPSARFVVGDVLTRLGRLPSRADLVVLDPPRTGAGEALVTAVASLGARAIAYVACDPAALGRDLRIAQRLGLTVASIRAFDLFPMTHHVECLALLEPA